MAAAYGSVTSMADEAQYTVSAPAELSFEQVRVENSAAPRSPVGFSFSIAQSAKVGLVGTSGAGKTTLLRLINRLISPGTGQICWQGKPLSHYPAPSLRQHIMLVPQEPRLLGMTVSQAFAYPLQLQRLSAVEIEQRIQKWQKRLTIPEDWGARQELELSVGQRQWVSIARALMTQPQILLLDEPTSALDSGRTDQLIHVINQLDCTVVIASHHFEMLQRTCDRILWLDQGTVLQDHPPQDIDWQEIRTIMAEKTAPDWDDLI